MVELDGFKTRMNGYEEPLKEVRDSLDLENSVWRSWRERWKLPDSGIMQSAPRR